MASNINRSFVFIHTHGPSAFLWCWTMKNCHHEPFFFSLLMVQVSYQLMMSDLNPLQSMCPPPLSIHLPLFQNRIGRECIGAIQSGTPAIRECSYPGESYIIINPSVCYIYAVWIHRGKATSGPPPAGRPPARYHIDIRFRHLLLTRAQCYRLRHATPLSPRHIQPRKFLFRSPERWRYRYIYSRP